MKNYRLNIIYILLALFSFSCEDYLDKSPESIIDTDEVFKDFDHAQGYVEQMYPLVVDLMYAGHSPTDFMLGDDAIINNTWMPSAQFDKGNLGTWYSNQFSFFNSNKKKNDPNDNTPLERPRIWNGSLMGIRQANIAIENIDLMINASQDEKDVVLGQAYFFRAYFHYELQKYWGRYPYIDKVLSDDYKLVRPETYKESALRSHEDFKMAAQLLPVNWDNESYGEKTLGDNELRLTKGAAYAFMGKNLLLAASPLMKGSTDTYDYDKELAAMAADAFAEVLKLADDGRYTLATFDNIEEVFWDVPYPSIPGGGEFIFNGIGFRNPYYIRQVISGQMDKKVCGDNGKIISPTHNFIHHNFGMSNGLSVQDDASGEFGAPLYNPEKPFENRDPRFYKWVTVDGDILIEDEGDKHHKAQLYKDGLHRNKSTGSMTGYFSKKFYPTLHSTKNVKSADYMPWRIRMRLTDVYLMYAEALHAAKGATKAPDSYYLTAEDVINLLRDRANYMPHVNSAIVNDKDRFMDEIRRERSVELSFEGHRWVDIRRWVLADKPLYKQKIGLNFPEINAEGKYTYLEEFLLIERVCEYPKHYWLPLPNDETLLYEGFPQNPGW